MKKISISIIASSVLIGFYSTSINTQGLHNVAQIKSIHDNLIKTSDNLSSVRDEVFYKLSTIEGASSASSINSWIILMLTSINFVIGCYLFYRNVKNVKKV